MLFQRFTILCLSLLVSTLAFAGGFLEIIKNTANQANFIIFNSGTQESSAKPLTSVQRYKKAIWEDSLLRNFVPTAELDRSLGSFSGAQKRPQVLLLANASKEDSDRHRLESAFIRPFKKLGADVYLLPMGAAAGLSEQEKVEFFDLLSKNFDLMISNGGDDLAPKLYGEALTYSVDTNLQRDKYESEVIKNYIDRGRGFMFGVCRGMQITAVTYGMKMYQDIPREIGAKVQHGGDNFIFHDLLLGPTENSILKTFVGGANQISGFSWHHQAVKYQDGTPFQIAASDLHSQFPEALEARNGRVLLTQFHPEYSRRIDSLGQQDKNLWGYKILQGVYSQAVKYQVKSCRQSL